MNTIHQNLLLPTIFWASMGVCVSLFSFGVINNYHPQNRMVSALPIDGINPTPLVYIPNVDISSQLSSDGTHELTMKKISNKDSAYTYEFSISKGSDNEKQLVYQKTLGPKSSMLIPFNTWSPDNQYFFIQEQGEERDSVMVFKSTRESFSEGEKYLDLTLLFKERGIKNNFKEATGWASPNLILINSITPEGNEGPSYWFEIPSKSIIQLGTKF